MSHTLTHKTTNFNEDFDLFSCQILFLGITLNYGDNYKDR
jgi:hypothetical protein